MEVFDCDQNSEEWFQLRAGIPTSSMFQTVMAMNKKGDGAGLTQITYMRKLAGELITGKPMDNYSNRDMERGHILEEEARRYYAYMADAQPEIIGFVRNGEMGASPDALVGKNGIVEIKTKAPHLLIGWILKNEFPPEHKAQCQGQLMIAEREWVDIVGYFPDMPMFCIRAGRDEKYIKELSLHIDRFNGQLHELVEKINSYRFEVAA